MSTRTAIWDLHIETSPQVYARIAGALYLVVIVFGAFADAITPAILMPALIGEASFCLWLLIKGVNVAKWRERLAAPA